MLDRDKTEVIELLEMILDSINVIQERTGHIKCGDDFLLSPDNMFILDGVCMKLIFDDSLLSKISTFVPKNR